MTPDLYIPVKELPYIQPVKAHKSGVDLFHVIDYSTAWNNIIPLEQYKPMAAVIIFKTGFSSN